MAAVISRRRVIQAALGLVAAGGVVRGPMRGIGRDAMAAPAPAAADQVVSVLSWNIQRYNSSWLVATPWRLRRAPILRQLNRLGADVMCLQEVRDPVAREIRAALPAHEWVGVARDDGHVQGEYAPILFRRDKFALVNSGWFWLSEQPARPSVGWDARYPRIATWVHLQPPAGPAFQVINTHFDHRGAEARKRSAWLVVSELFRRCRGGPAIVTGDLNARERDAPLATLQLFLTNGASDPRGRQVGPRNTHLTGRIDHILYSRHFAPTERRTLPNRFLSDHAALHYELRLSAAPLIG